MSWLSIAADENGLPVRAGLGIAEELTPEALDDMIRDWKPGPLMVLPPDEPRRIVWVVKQASGGNVRVLAERHHSVPTDAGSELRLYNGEGPATRRIATFRAGSWHWCVAESALEPKAGDR